jgi:hypothetical protein
MRGIGGIEPAWGVTVLRIATGLVFAVHGYQKFAGCVANVSAFFAKQSIPLPELMGPFIAALARIQSRTAEQAAAFGQLRALAAPFRFRVVADPEGFPAIPGRFGSIEYHDGQVLAVYTDRPRLFAKLWAIPGARRHQTGDQEMRALFPPEALDQVAGVIRARRRRVLSPEAARKRSGLATVRAVSGG